MERFVREIGIVSCATAALVKARTNAIAHLRLNSILGPRQITQSPNCQTVFIALLSVQENQQPRRRGLRVSRKTTFRPGSARVSRAGAHKECSSACARNRVEFAAVSTEVKKEIELEIAYVLFADIDGYPKLLMDLQRQLLDLVDQVVR